MVESFGRMQKFKALERISFSLSLISRFEKLNIMSFRLIALFTTSVYVWQALDLSYETVL